MILSPDTTPPPEERCAARARRARAFAWPVRLALMACVGAAIWQEPRLAPPVHARMQDAAAYAETFAASERLRGLLARMNGGSSSGNGAGLSGRIVEVLKP